MRIREQDVLIPTSMVGNYPNPRWWDASFARHFRGDREPPDAMNREALEDAVGAITRDQEKAGLDIISDGRVHGDNYADQAVYHYFRCMGYNLHGGHLGFPIYSRLHSGTVEREIKRRGGMMVEQARAQAGDEQADQGPIHRHPGPGAMHKRSLLQEFPRPGACDCESDE